MRRNSSSEEGLGQVFSEARRSKRYMSKRTSGTFREYLKTRSIEMIMKQEEFSSVEQSHSCASDSNNSLNNLTYPTIKSSGGTIVRRGSMRRSTKMSPNYDNNLNCKNNATVSSPSGSEKCDSPRNSLKNSTTSNDSFLKKYDNEVTAPKTQFESTDDWYASASDMDDSDSAVSKPYGYNAVNPVLECVNQVRNCFIFIFVHISM